MKNILLILLAIVSLSACAAKKATTKHPSVTYVKMDRTACFGRCPVYSVEVYDNGLVRYNGKQFTEYSGIYEKNLGAAQAKAVLNDFAKYRVDTCKNLYENRITDVPGIYFTITINGKQKEIANAHFGPHFFNKLATEVDSFAKVDASWKKVADTQNK